MSAVTFAEARRTVEEHARRQKPGGMESVPLLEAYERVLAEEIVADRDLPPFPRATRDGYAVKAADLHALPRVGKEAAAQEAAPRLEVIGESKAGACPEAVPQGIQPGQAVEIMTGAPVPAGADAVVMVEHTVREGRFVIPARGAAPGENIVLQGAEARAGEKLLAPGTRLHSAAIAVAASTGKFRLAVYRRPRVAILATGDELVEISERPGPSQIRNSNSYSLAAQVAGAGAEPVILPVAPDEAGELRKSIVRGLAADLLLLAGGVSMGKYDLVEQVLAQLQAKFHFTEALIQPGRPIVFGELMHEGEGASRQPQLFFGLPGNPVSTMVTFDLFVQPVIEALAGAAAKPLVFLKAVLKSGVRTKTGLTRFLPAVLGGEFARAEVEAIRWQGSGDVAARARANCYLVVPPDRGHIPAGEAVNVLVHFAQ
jgi:molybdopterin molybdotransferase